MHDAIDGGKCCLLNFCISVNGNVTIALMTNFFIRYFGCSCCYVMFVIVVVVFVVIVAFLVDIVIRFGVLSVSPKFLFKSLIVLFDNRV